MIHLFLDCLSLPLVNFFLTKSTQFHRALQDDQMIPDSLSLLLVLRYLLDLILVSWLVLIVLASLISRAEDLRSNLPSTTQRRTRTSV